MVVPKLEGHNTFVVLPRRWVVERTFAWLMRYRRLRADDETEPTSSWGWILVSVVHRMAAASLGEFAYGFYRLHLSMNQPTRQALYVLLVLALLTPASLRGQNQPSARTPDLIQPSLHLDGIVVSQVGHPLTSLDRLVPLPRNGPGGRGILS